MPKKEPIPKLEAQEQLARATEASSPDDLVEIYAEIFPRKDLPDVSGDRAAELAKELARYIRNGIAPELIVDLWNVVFTHDMFAHECTVYYDEESEMLCFRDREYRYAGE